MKEAFLLVLMVMGIGHYAAGAMIPYYRMDSLAFLSSDIVLCEEGEWVQTKRKNASGYEYECFDATFTVINVLKGSIKPKEQITVEISTLYTRQLAEDALAQPSGKGVAVPKGKALLFLEREGNLMRPVLGGVKLVIKDEVFCYGQFVSNPGPLWLARMAPENIQVRKEEPYGEDLLMKDVKIAIEEARKLSKATFASPRDSTIRRESPNKTDAGDGK
jgi:hypothetical protein